MERQGPRSLTRYVRSRGRGRFGKRFGPKADFDLRWSAKNTWGEGFLGKFAWGDLAIIAWGARRCAKFTRGEPSRLDPRRGPKTGTPVDGHGVAHAYEQLAQNRGCADSYDGVRIRTPSVPVCDRIGGVFAWVSIAATRLRKSSCGVVMECHLRRLPACFDSFDIA